MRSNPEADRARGDTMLGSEPPAIDLAQPFDDGVSARALLLSIRRHLAIVVGLTLLLCVAGALVGLGLPAWYQAQGVLIIRARPLRTAEIQELPDPVVDANVIQSE